MLINKNFFQLITFIIGLVINGAVEQSLIIDLSRSNSLHKYRNRDSNINARRLNYERTNDFESNENNNYGKIRFGATKPKNEGSFRRSNFNSIPNNSITKLTSSRRPSNFIQIPSKNLLPNSIDEVIFFEKKFTFFKNRNKKILVNYFKHYYKSLIFVLQHKKIYDI